MERVTQSRSLSWVGSLILGHSLPYYVVKLVTICINRFTETYFGPETNEIKHPPQHIFRYGTPLRECSTYGRRRTQTLLRYPPHLLLRRRRTPRRRQPHENLEAIVDTPLQRGQRPNHEDPENKTVPQPHEADVFIYPAHSGAEGFAWLAVRVQFGNHDVGGVGDYSAEDTG